MDASSLSDKLNDTNKTDNISQMNYYSKKILLLLLMMASALSMSAVTASDINAIKAGNILHCFDWTYAQIQAELDNIKAAGFTSIQTSPAQANYTGSTSWNTLYRPRDTEVGPNTLGTKEQLTALCTAAHQKGLYIIVDVVANHTDGSLDWVADYWKNKDLYHDMTLDYSANDGSRYAVTHGDIGMCDLKTYDSRVYSKFKTYIQALKTCGVDGIRWDAAKHIGLPSEDDEFWNQALDKSMYNYGEVLHTMGGGSDGTTIPELQNYMSVTDANYGTNKVLSSFKSGRAPSVAGCWAMEFNNDKWVYWGESHDTFCNGDGASKGVGQNVVDRAYAVAAAHNNIPALYFSRPNGGDNAGPGCQAGQKGSTHFTSKEVAEINNLKLLCAGEPDYYSESNGNCSVTRKSGAVIVKGSGSGNVSVPNGGGYLAPGEYTDHVSGATFTVTASTISGSVGSSGIAVLYGTATPKPAVTLSPNGGSFTTETTTVTATLVNATSGWYKIDNGQQKSFTGTTTITIGSGIEYGKTTTISWSATGSEGTETGSATYTKKDPNAVTYVYFNNTQNWSSVYAYNWKEGTTTSVAEWPGTQLTEKTSEGYYKYEITDDSYNMIIFNNGSSSKTDDLAVVANHLYTPNGDSGEYTGGGQGGGGGDEGDGPTFTGYRVYLNNTANWSTVNCYSWNATNTSISGAWPGSAMQKDNNTGYYYIDFSEEPTNVIFSTNGNSQTDDLTFKNGNLYDCSGNDKAYATCTGQGGGGGGDTGKGTYTITYNNPNNWSSVNCYVWDAGDNNKKYLGDWPGTAMTKDGNVWTITLSVDKPLVKGMVIFNGDGKQTANLSLADYAKFTPDGPVTSMQSVRKPSTDHVVVYNLQGMRVSQPVKGGIYIINGRKVVMN